MFSTAIRRFGLGVVATATAASGALLAPAAHAAGTYTLLILPDQGENAIYSFINTATKTIDVTMYELRDTTVTTALVDQAEGGRQGPGDPGRQADLGQQRRLQRAAGRRRQRRLLLLGCSPTRTRRPSRSTARRPGSAPGTWTAPTTRPRGTTGSSTPTRTTSPPSSRCSTPTSPKTSITPADGDNLVWSPTDSQTHLLALINGATNTLDIQQEEFGDTALINAVVAAAEARGHGPRGAGERRAASTTARSARSRRPAAR